MLNSKKIVSLALALIMIIGMSLPVHALENTNTAEYEKIYLHTQAKKIIDSIDMESLKQEVLLEKTDYTVPYKVRQQTKVSANFKPYDNALKDNVQTNEKNMVKKIGEVKSINGEVNNLYASIAMTEVNVKEDSGFANKYGVKAWASVYWIDVKGSDNILEAVGGSWDTNGKTVSGRQIVYGKTDIFGISWLGTAHLESTEEDCIYIDDPEECVGLTLKCKTYITVGNYGEVTCSAVTSFATT